MKYIALLAAVTVGSWPASSQVSRPMPYPTTAQLDTAGEQYQLRTRQDGYFATELPGKQRECLTRLKTGRVECRTREQWQRIAARLRTNTVE